MNRKEATIAIPMALLESNKTAKWHITMLNLPFTVHVRKGITAVNCDSLVNALHIPTAHDFWVINACK